MDLHLVDLTVLVEGVIHNVDSTCLLRVLHTSKDGLAPVH